MSTAADTPLMRQYRALKQQHPDAVLLFRVGDFYETFGQDAIEASSILGIVLTKRSNGAAASIELAGFPHHSLDTYLPKLVKAGRKVAVCEQLEDPKLTKKLVERGVTDVVSPGVNQLEPLLEGGKNNFLAACTLERGFQGLALLDVSTGDFFYIDGDDDALKRIADAYAPSEWVVPRGGKGEFIERFGPVASLTELPDWAGRPEQSRQLLQTHFGTETLRGFAPEGDTPGLTAAGMAIAYVRSTGRTELEHIHRLERIPDEKRMWIDGFTLRNLEVFQANHADGLSLSSSVDACCSPMGKRLLRRRLAAPLRDQTELGQRLDEVEGLREAEKRFALRALLQSLPDVERSLGRLATGRIAPRELRALAEGLARSEQLFQTEAWTSWALQWKPLGAAVMTVLEQLEDEPGPQAGKGKVIRRGVSEELDRLRTLSANVNRKLEDIQEREARATGIGSLKVAFNSVFGYYLEVRNTHRDRVPQEWIRKQTLVNAERYITPELKEFEAQILGAEERIMALEIQLYQELIVGLKSEIVLWGHNVRLLAQWDVASSWAEIAGIRKWCRPEWSESGSLEIVKGRHPVIEAALPPGVHYVPNDVRMDPEGRQMLLVTGPNMSGKSALLRQVALMAILAQTGGFVPAQSALLPLFDRVFVRVGASDNLSKGESTFMVEMIETGGILNNLRGRCLVVLDEIGRGTSTYDGVSIAWSIAEFLHDHPNRPLTLFATHYHELSDMEGAYPRIRNVSLSIREEGERIVFLRTLVDGASARSFGIHVARMAGLPALVVQRSAEQLRHFEGVHKGAPAATPTQLSFFQLGDPLLEEIRETLSAVDPEHMTPMEALILVQQLKRRMGKVGSK